MADEPESAAASAEGTVNKIGPIDAGQASAAPVSSAGAASPEAPAPPRTAKAILIELLTFLVARMGNPGKLKSLLAELEAIDLE